MSKAGIEIMEIAPIPGIRAVAAVRPREAETRAPAIFDIDASSRPGDDAEQHNRRKAAGAEEDEEDDLTLDGEPSPERDGSDDARTGQVDYFA